MCFPRVFTDCRKNNRYRKKKFDFPNTLPDRGRPQQPIKPDWCIPLGPLMHDESTNAGTIDILQDIYQDQFGFDEDKQEDMEQFEDRLFLHMGDALTTMRMWAAKAEKSADDSAYGSGKWILPVFGLWHLKYNYAKMIIAEHWGGHDDDLSSLYQVWHSMYTDRYCDHKIFQVIDNLIIQSFYSRLVALFLRYLYEKQDSVDFPFEFDASTPPDRVSVAEWWKKQTPTMLNTIVLWIYGQIDPASNVRRTDPHYEETVDTEWTNHFNFLQNVYPYILLSDAIRYNDLGLMKLAMQLTLVMFAGNDNTWIYQRELCFYNWLVNSDAAQAGLQRAVIRESMINRSGQPDGYYPMDLANELLNLLITKAKTLRRTSSLTVQKLMERYTRTAHYVDKLSSAFDRVVEIRNTRYHTKKALDDHVWLLATNLWAKDHAQNSSITYTPGRGTPTRMSCWYDEGQRNLMTIINKFNNVKATALVGGDLETSEDAELQVENARSIQVNNQLLERQYHIMELTNRGRRGPTQTSTSIQSIQQPHTISQSSTSSQQVHTQPSTETETQGVILSPYELGVDISEIDPDLAQMLDLLETSREEFEETLEDRRADPEDSEQEDETQDMSEEQIRQAEESAGYFE